MDGDSISETVADSARRLRRYLVDMRYVEPGLGVSETRVDSVSVRGRLAELRLSSRVPDVSGAALRVDGRLFEGADRWISRCDEPSRTLVLEPPDEVLAALRDAPARSVSLESDMTFLIRQVEEFYRRYGRLVGVPRPGGRIDPVYPERGSPSGEQRRAAEGIGRDAMSYVWGAPGTGKTQFVLSSCIRGCILAGERVAVFAPTNSSVEQVLRGVIASFPDGPPEGVLRLGTPTAGFFEEHRGMCEDRHAERELASCMRAADLLREVLRERSYDSVAPHLERLESCDAWDLGDLRRRMPWLVPSYEAVESSVGSNSDASDALRRDGPTVAEKAAEIRGILFDRPRPALAVTEYSGWSDVRIRGELGRLESRASDLRASTTAVRLAEARIVAATPYQFISRFRPRGAPEDGRPELDVDRIFLDEAGYCGLVQALSLFSNGVPVALLGDHMQLPPVSELDEERVRGFAADGGGMQDAFLWSLPAVWCETVLAGPLHAVRGRYLAGGGPEFAITGRYDLTRTRRFGPNLAEVLDRFVYRNGMRGDGASLRIVCVNVPDGGREERGNPSEADAVAEYIGREAPDPADVAVLSPYRKQCALVKGRLPGRYADCVMSVHASQGREWDTVVVTVADSRNESRDVPYRFTSSETPIGLKVMNTAVSRARRMLVLVCDADFWKGREGELVGGLCAAADETVDFRPRPRRCRGRA